MRVLITTIALIFSLSVCAGLKESKKTPYELVREAFGDARKMNYALQGAKNSYPTTSSQYKKIMEWNKIVVDLGTEIQDNFENFK